MQLKVYFLSPTCSRNFANIDSVSGWITFEDKRRDLDRPRTDLLWDHTIFGNSYWIQSQASFDFVLCLLLKFYLEVETVA